MKISKELKKRIEKVVSEEIDIVPYDSKWPQAFEKEAQVLRSKFPRVTRRIEHFGSTAMPGISSKPIVDMLVEVSSLKEVKKEVVPALTAEGYDYFWRPTIGNEPPYYAWFIKRDSKGKRTHHIHMVEADSELWDRIYFRDYLRQYPQEAKSYEKLKIDLSKRYQNDRVSYTKAKTDFITSITEKAKKYYNKTDY